MKLGRTLPCLPLLFLLGCSLVTEHRIEKAVKQDRWEDAIVLLEERYRFDPENPELLRDMGRAYVESERYDLAVRRLREAERLNPADRSIPLLLGLAYEGREQWQRAIDAYHSYPGSTGGSATARAVRGRISRLVGRAYGVWADSVFATPPAISPDLIAVRYFDVLAETETYGNLGKGMAEQLVNDFTRIQGLRVVPRLSFEALKKKAESARTEGYDPLAVSTVDVMLGAGWSIGGTILPREEENEIRIDFYLVNNATGETYPPTSVSGTLAEFFELEKRIAFEVLEKLGVTPTLPERHAISVIPTTNFKAFLAYCDALDAEDRAEHAKARGLFDQAVRLDPEFVLAAERGERTRGSGETIRGIIEAEIARPEDERRTARVARTASMLFGPPVPAMGEGSDLSNVRATGGASLTVRVEKP